MAEPTRRPSLVLASASPRRRELLARLGIEPDVRPAHIDETPAPEEPPAALVARLARQKAEATDRQVGEVVLAADTVVVLDGEILGKPADDADARTMLARLSDRTHEVLTGVHVIGDTATAGAVETTTVVMRALSDAEIDTYVATGEPADKAGGYAIQGMAGMFVTGIDGSDTNVIGLPLATVARLLAEVGVPVLPPSA